MIESASGTTASHPDLIAPSASVAPSARIGAATRVWDLSQVREGAVIGAKCVLGRSVYVDHDVTIGDACKIQNNALIYWPARLADGVFIGPGAILANDRHPRAAHPDMTPIEPGNWVPDPVIIDQGASVGAGAIVLPGVHIGAWAMVGAGSVVIREVVPYSLVAGNPARQMGWVGRSGQRLVENGTGFDDPVTGDRFRMTDSGPERVQ